MKRNFFNESLFNIFLRSIRALTSRLRGKLFFLLNLFYKQSSSKIIFGRGPRFINSKSILLNENVSFGDFVRIECFSNKKNPKPLISIGKRTSFGDFCHLGAMNNINIGNNVLGGSKILIMDHDHGKGGDSLERYKGIPPRERELISKGSIVIEDNVWLGESCTILSGAHIGKGSIVAANSLVSKRIEPFSVCVGQNNVLKKNK